MFVAFEFLRQKVKQVESTLLLKLSIDLLFPKFVEELMCKSLGCVKPLFG
jgi:hypothetical protein